MAEEVYETLSDGAQRSGSRAGLDSHYTDDTRMVSILTLHLGKLSLAQISGDKSSSLLLDAASLATSVSDPQDYQQFQFRFDPYSNLTLFVQLFDFFYCADLVSLVSPGQRVHYQLLMKVSLK